VARRLSRFLHRLLPYNERVDWLPAAIEQSWAWGYEPSLVAVISTSPPLATHLAAYAFHRRYGVPWVADFQDPLLDNPFRDRNWARWYDSGLERWIFRRAAVVLANTEPVAELWRRRYPQWSAKIHVLWNGYDPEEAPVKPRPACAPRLIVHAGSLYGHRRPTAFVRAFSMLVRSGAVQPGQWRVVFAGPVADEPFRECSEELGMLQHGSYVEIRAGQFPKEQLNELIAQASTLLLLDLTGRNTSVQLPAKIFDYLRSGIPILAWSPRDSPTRYVLERAGVPYLAVDPEEELHGVALRLRQWLSEPPLPAAPNDWFLTTFDGRRQVAELARLLDSLTTRS